VTGIGEGLTQCRSNRAGSQNGKLHAHIIDDLSAAVVAIATTHADKSPELRASVIARRRPEGGVSGGVLPLRATTPAVDSKRDA
jgi:hypothetical protein